MIDRTLSIAPMLDWTDRHERYFLRLISRHALLYTEMVTTGAILHGDAARHLDFSAEEHPLALQLGGSEPAAMAECAKRGEDWGYDEININVGCPSDRVQNGSFGACLMASPQTVAECVDAMRDAVNIPVTVKCRIGIDHEDAYEPFEQFVRTVAAAGCDTFVVHARKAWLEGLSPKENREIPPLRYDFVYRLKREMPQLHVSINGGIKTLAEAQAHLRHVDGVMIGREAYHNPYMLADADRLLFGDDHPVPGRLEVLETYMDYVQRMLDRDIYLGHMTRHILGLFHGQYGGRAFRRHISENAYKPGAGVQVIREAARGVVRPVDADSAGIQSTAG